MGRIVAIDYGQKRVGVAVTDEQQIIATALETIPVKDIFQFLRKYVENEDVESIVVGDPRQMDNSPSASVKFIDPFVKKLKKDFQQLKIERYDERFTSKIAQRTILEAGLKKKDRRDKSIVDKVSAVIILQSYLESRQFLNSK